ncbi:MAG: hypothetical protein WC916_01600 [Candidatus Woesearchaeota archaeon]
MLKQKHTLLFIIITILLANIVVAAPAMEGIAISPETKICAGYWAGDEFTQYKLPIGWEVYYPDYGKGGIVETRFGNCTLERGNEEQCCNTLELIYVSSNIGKKYVARPISQEFISNPLSWIVFAVILLTIIFAVRYFLKRHKKINQNS